MVRNINIESTGRHTCRKTSWGKHWKDNNYIPINTHTGKQETCQTDSELHTIVSIHRIEVETGGLGLSRNRCNS